MTWLIVYIRIDYPLWRNIKNNSKLRFENYLTKLPGDRIFIFVFMVNLVTLQFEPGNIKNEICEFKTLR